MYTYRMVNPGHGLQARTQAVDLIFGCARTKHAFLFNVRPTDQLFCVGRMVAEIDDQSIGLENRINEDYNFLTCHSDEEDLIFFQKLQIQSRIASAREPTAELFRKVIQSLVDVIHKVHVTTDTEFSLLLLCHSYLEIYDRVKDMENELKQYRRLVKILNACQTRAGIDDGDLVLRFDPMRYDRIGLAPFILPSPNAGEDKTIRVNKIMPKSLILSNPTLSQSINANIPQF